jgi:hypothetical protein
MSIDRSYEGPYPTPESRGIDTAYEAVRDQAESELAGTAAEPKQPLQAPTGSDIKNPDGEYAAPSPMTGPRPSVQPGPGPDQVGNSSGRGPVDPQGQQAGTEGGRPGSAPTNPEAGTPVAEPEERKEESDQRYGAGVNA